MHNDCTTNAGGESTACPCEKCHHDEHLRRGVEAKLYSLIYRLGKKAGDGWIEVNHAWAARKIGHSSRRGALRPGSYIGRAAARLVEAGWLQEHKRRKSQYGTWLVNRYRAIPHREWIKHKHAELGRCPCGPGLVVEADAPATRCSPALPAISLCWVGQTEDYQAVDGRLWTRRVDPGKTQLDVRLRERDWLIDAFRWRESPSALAQTVLERAEEITEESWLASGLVWQFAIIMRQLGRLHEDDQGAHFGLPGMAGWEIHTKQYALPVLRRVMRTTRADLATAYRIWQHALDHHFLPDETVSAKEFFAAWQDALGYSLRCLTAWRYHDGTDAFADWYDPKLEPRRDEPPELVEGEGEGEGEDEDEAEAPKTSAQQVPEIALDLITKRMVQVA